MSERERAERLGLLLMGRMSPSTPGFLDLWESHREWADAILADGPVCDVERRALAKLEDRPHDR